MKTLLLVLLFAPALAYAQKKPTAARYELRGIVTYFFNDNFGYKPDVGAKAYIIPEGTVKAAHINVAALEKYLATGAVSVFVPGQERTPEEIAASNAAMEMEPAAVAANNAIATNKATVAATADGNGVFLKKLPTGRYVILIVSANRSRENLVEVSGQRLIKRVSISGQEQEVSAKFDL